MEDTLHDPRVYYKFYMYFIVRSHPPENGAYYMNNLFGPLLTDSRWYMYFPINPIYPSNTCITDQIIWSKQFVESRAQNK